MREAFLVGLACSALQMTLIYGLCFLYSATIPAYVSTMLSWFFGGAVGCWVPRGLRSGWMFLLAGAVHLLNTWLLVKGSLLYSWLLAAGLGGAAGAHWVCRRGVANLGGALFSESLGMAAGFLLCSLIIYRGGMGLIWIAPVTTIFVWAGEKR